MKVNVVLLMHSDILLEFVTKETFDVWVIVFILGPERLWTILELVKVRGNSDGGLPNCADVQIAC